ncbi:DUF5908 family protein [Pseudocnuella soli]|uniref:DUF5908 family protein n=1 Tax=Pseudocnuella soli TaxID=2502779 RepID=UPI00104F888B|nr:DUF5908 family protein [Pseudocnuella soli]
MPVEIRELQVKVTVNQPSGQQERSGAASVPQTGDKEEQQALINQCIEQVLDILNSKKER